MKMYNIINLIVSLLILVWSGFVFYRGVVINRKLLNDNKKLLDLVMEQQKFIRYLVSKSKPPAERSSNEN
jgi:hypothetical protein